MFMLSSTESNNRLREDIFGTAELCTFERYHRVIGFSPLQRNFWLHREIQVSQHPIFAKLGLYSCTLEKYLDDEDKGIKLNKFIAL